MLDGTGTAHAWETACAIGPGDFLGHPKGGAAHSIENTGPGPRRCLVIGERRPHDVGDYPRLGKRLYRNAGQPWNLVDIAAIQMPTGGAKR